MSTRLLWIGLLLCYSGFAQSRACPTDLVFLLDLDSSMVEPQRLLAGGAKLASYEISSADRTAIATYSSGFKIVLPLAPDASRVAAAFQKASTWVMEHRQKPHVFDALFQALALFPADPDPARNRLILTITNDIDYGSRHSAADVVRQAKAQKVKISFALIATPHPQISAMPYPDLTEAERIFPIVAQPTGGRVVTKPVGGYALRQLVSELKGCAP